MTKHSLAKILTYSGILPFLICTFLLFTGHTHFYGLNLLFVLLGYGAVIISFIAGIHWGAYLFKDAPFNLFIHSNIIALTAWCALIIMKPVSLAILMGCLIYLLVIDILLAKHDIWEQWYLKMRTRITIYVTGLLSLSLYSFLMG